MKNKYHPDIGYDWEVPNYETTLYKAKANHYCLVVPVINEGERIKALLLRLKELRIYELCDVILVDGGSEDNSLSVELLIATKVSALLLKLGPGKLSAQLRCAYAFALQQGYGGIITIDGNNKDDPNSIPLFIAALNKGVDFAQASRYILGGRATNTPKIRDLAIRYLHSPILRFFSGFRWTDTTQGFRAYSRKMLMDPNVAIFREVFMTYEMLAYLSYRAPKLGYLCVEIPTHRCYPKNGIPTKINGIANLVSLFKILIFSCLGVYNPKKNKSNFLTHIL